MDQNYLWPSGLLWIPLWLSVPRSASAYKAGLLACYPTFTVASVCLSSTMALSMVCSKATALCLWFLFPLPGIGLGVESKLTECWTKAQEFGQGQMTKAHVMFLKSSTWASQTGPARLLANKRWRLSFKAVDRAFPMTPATWGTLQDHGGQS